MCCKYSFKFILVASLSQGKVYNKVEDRTNFVDNEGTDSFQHSKVPQRGRLQCLLRHMLQPTYINSKGLYTLHCDGRVARETLMTQHFSTRGSGFDALSKAGHRRHHDSDTQGSDNQH